MLRQTIVPPNITNIQVLAEYNGPQIVLVTASDMLNPLLGVAADEDEDFVRWIAAPITHAERLALADGVLPTRSVFLKHEVIVIDVDHTERPRRAWEAAHLSDDDLPREDVVLPRSARSLLAEPLPAIPEMSIDRLGSAKAGIPVRPLASILDVLQRLWNALVQSIAVDVPTDRGPIRADLTDRAALSVTGGRVGSLILELSPADPLVFNEVSQTFNKLVGAGYNPEALAIEFNRLGPRVQARYGEFLSVLQKHDLQLLTRWSKGSFFLGSHLTQRILTAFPKAVVGEPRTTPVLGYFVAYDTRQRTFEFHDTEGDENYKGAVHSDVLDASDAVSVGSGAMYTAHIEVVTQLLHSGAVIESYTLRSAKPVSADT